MENKKKRVLVAMSGGVDSSAVCMLLLNQGYQIEGVTMRMWDTERSFAKFRRDEPDYILEARSLAEKLNFPHHVLDVRPEFKAKVIDYFTSEYLSGRTPNPCVECNRHIKWKLLLDLADRRNCEYIATGHYAQIEQTGDFFYIKKGDDEKKDQSYFLWGVSQEILSRAMMPLGRMTKEETKAEAIKNGFDQLVKKSESMEICFVEKDYRDFLRENIPSVDENPGQGYFVDKQGKKLGVHKGFPFYTIGQRKGLEIALGYPAYVLKINPRKNTIMLGEKEQLETNRMLVENYLLVNPSDVENNKKVEVRIRYRSKPEPATIEIIDENYLQVHFETPVSAVTPGQSAVFYSGDCVLGGGVIANFKNSCKFSREA
ncbi:MAG: tRNA 2-thiouridine(34) synthase MnmA [Prevotellaceae bacterium]|nr:tRNA 2-thiouridine(34) synthase MnmA [Prevotellaceae bacterium]